MKRIAEIIRLPNLIIVGITEYLFLYCLLFPLYNKTGVSPSLSNLEFFSLVAATLLVTAGGYLINDIEDVETDKINRPEKVWVGSIFTAKQAFLLYLIINAAGLLISVCTAISIGQPVLSLLYPLAAAGLYIYSAILKAKPLVGNLFVSLFCALVFVLVLFAEREAFYNASIVDPVFAMVVYQVFAGFALFGFLITMIRELVKDLEDYHGDRLAKLKTLPVAYGQNHSEKLIRLFFYLTALLGMVFIIWNVKIAGWAPWGVVFGIICIFVPLLQFILLFERPGDERPYKKMSRVLKLLMVLGLLYLPLFRLFIA